jgi:hypothetical protein
VDVSRWGNLIDNLEFLFVNLRDAKVGFDIERECDLPVPCERCLNLPSRGEKGIFNFSNHCVMRYFGDKNLDPRPGVISVADLIKAEITKEMESRCGTKKVGVRCFWAPQFRSGYVFSFRPECGIVEKSFAHMGVNSRGDSGDRVDSTAPPW